MILICCLSSIKIFHDYATRRCGNQPINGSFSLSPLIESSRGGENWKAKKGMRRWKGEGGGVVAVTHINSNKQKPSFM